MLLNIKSFPKVKILLWLSRVWLVDWMKVRFSFRIPLGNCMPWIGGVVRFFIPIKVSPSKEKKEGVSCLWSGKSWLVFLFRLSFHRHPSIRLFFRPNFSRHKRSCCLLTSTSSTFKSKLERKFKVYNFNSSFTLFSLSRWSNQTSFNESTDSYKERRQCNFSHSWEKRRNIIFDFLNWESSCWDCLEWN